ncbi:hypothetical protein D6855_14145 [Butyrivibrio sp. CB08]|uniref:DUF6462 family protein n=1 Tax=Butyrivibrio sp. CB08 TaxID=2364879 RepID=UPI000EA839DD|nr:DUF6462 family protein [Butyrivibrio sp. CB08]RKM56806.1 hypothetical protein D6855_14145 [Butyrivibrio sp. CB08]
MPARKTNITNVAEAVKSGKKFVTYKEGKDLYSMGLHTFEKMAKDAGAIYHIKRRVLVNTEIFDAFMENFRDANYTS